MSCPSPSPPPSPTSERVPADMWKCCQCNDGNLIELAAEKCPVCQHDRCQSCKPPKPSSAAEGTSVAAIPALSYGNEVQNPYHSVESPSYTSSPTYGSAPLWMNGYNIAFSGSSNMSGGHNFNYDDVWVCCQCGGTNLNSLARECCPVCRHYRRGCC